MGIYAELARIQQGLKAPKNLFNKFGQYYYRNAEGILEAVKPMLNGLAIIINDEPVLIGERFYIKATVTLTDGSESVSAVAYAREDETKKGMDGCQITGACSSYARKYALNALLMIDDNKDSDDDQLSPKNPDNEVKPAQKHAQKPQNAPVQAAVTAVDKLPQTNPQAPAQAEKPAQEAPKTPGAFLQLRIAEMKAKYPNFNFISARKGLIEGGVVPDIPSATMTMEQAVQLADAVEDIYAGEQQKVS